MWSEMVRCNQNQGKVSKMLEVERPVTKKQIRAFIGLTSYYREFIPNFATIVAPLTDLTRKGKANTVEWTDSQVVAFQTLKDKMSRFPILKLPDVIAGILSPN